MTVVKLSQRKKAASAMVVAELGIVMDVIFDCLKAVFSIVMRLSGRMMEVSPVLRKELILISFTALGIVIDCIDPQFWKALTPMLVTRRPPTTSGMVTYPLMPVPLVVALPSPKLVPIVAVPSPLFI